jgi:hypothetical protein
MPRRLSEKKPISPLVDVKVSDGSQAESSTKLKPSKGRGKSADPDNFVKVTIYVRRQTYRAVKKCLIDDELEMSELIERLLCRWLEGRGVAGEGNRS